MTSSDPRAAKTRSEPGASSGGARAPVAAGLLALLLAAAPSGAAAQSKADAFEGKIPPVSGQLFRKAGRVELTASGNLSLDDAFYTKYFGGLKLGYHFTESLSADLEATGGTAVKTDSAVVCTPSAGCGSPTAAQMSQVPGRIRWIAGAQAAWAPIYGKLDVLSEQVGHFDLSVLGGLDLVAYDEVLSATDALLGPPKTKTTFGGHLGVGSRLFVSEMWAVRLELKDYMYTVVVPNGGIGTKLQHQLFMEVGLSMFLPGSNRLPR
ncbi:MAG TPA: outer membrane beta-barrel domain-containing protein [Anaeromyxobacter sp.]